MDRLERALIPAVGVLAAVMIAAFVAAWVVLLSQPKAPAVRLDQRPAVMDVDGRCMVPQDLNGDGVVSGDLELGS